MKSDADGMPRHNLTAARENKVAEEIAKEVARDAIREAEWQAAEVASASPSPLTAAAAASSLTIAAAVPPEPPTVSPVASNPTTAPALAEQTGPGLPPLEAGLEKTEMCPVWVAGGTCTAVELCTYAHDPEEAETHIADKVKSRKEKRRFNQKLGQAEADREKAEEDIAGAAAAATAAAATGGGGAWSKGTVAAGPRFDRLDASQLSFEMEMNASGTWGYKFVVGEDKTVWYGRCYSDEPQSGGGTVTVATDCVIKKVDPKVEKSELSILKKCKDQQLTNVCKLLDFYQTGDGSPSSPYAIYVALEPCDMTLSQALKRGLGGAAKAFAPAGPSFDQRVDWCDGMVAGLLSLHTIGIAHRDFKPSNVLLKLESGKWKVKITDFGCSRLVPADMQDSTLQSTLHGYTKTWCAQEVLVRRVPGASLHKSREKFTMQSWYRADIFALGCTMYHCLARQQSNVAGSEVGKPLATHPFGHTTVDIDSNIMNSAHPLGKADLLRSWDDHACGTAGKSQILARLHDGWRLVLSMLSHNAAKRPTASAVSARLASEGLKDTVNMVRVGVVFAHGKTTFSQNKRLLQAVPVRDDADSVAVEWRGASSRKHRWDAAVARDWIKAFSPDEAAALRYFVDSGPGENWTAWYQKGQLWQVFTLARNVIQHIDPQHPTVKAIFADPAEAHGGTINFYQNAAADLFACRFPVLVDVFWDGLGDGGVSGSGGGSGNGGGGGGGGRATGNDDWTTV